MAGDAETLRRAATLMRERAEAACDVTGASDWFSETRGLHFTGEYGVRSSGGFVAGDTTEEGSEHIASWRPAVAFSVADWLVGEALNPSVWNLAALAVANAYLGERV